MTSFVSTTRREKVFLLILIWLALAAALPLINGFGNSNHPVCCFCLNLNLLLGSSLSHRRRRSSHSLSLLPSTTVSSCCFINNNKNKNNNMPPNLKLFHSTSPQLDQLLGSKRNHQQDKNKEDDEPQQAEQRRLRCAVLGCGMMGQEHVSYMSGYPQDLSIDFLCDPHPPSLQKCMQVFQEFAKTKDNSNKKTNSKQQQQPPILLETEQELLQHVRNIDLLVIASPNYLHTDTLLRWGQHDVTILLEKPVAVSREQHDQLAQASLSASLQARVWVAMEYRFIPAIAKLIDLLPTIGDIQMCTIRENRFPFLHKIGSWNRDPAKTGDTLVEKCCHFFDLMRLITGQEANLDHVRAIAQRGINYLDEQDKPENVQPIIDSAYVFMTFLKTNQQQQAVKTMGCLELCMFADGSRHQEEIVVTGTKGRLEAYLPENKVYAYERPNHKEWSDRSIPPPLKKEVIYDCSNVQAVHHIKDDDEKPMPTHSGYHYSSTAVEWYRLLGAMRKYDETGEWKPHVSLQDGLRAVEIGLEATRAIVNEE